MHYAGLLNNTQTFNNPVTLYNLDNVQKVDVSFYTLLGQLVHYGTSFECSNGFEGNLIVDVQGITGGLASAIYIMPTVVQNETMTCLKKLQIFYDRDDTNTYNNVCNCREEGVEKACCRNDYYVEQYETNCQGDSIFEYSAIDRLYISVASPFEVKPETYVDFIASESIQFGAGFKTNLQSTMIAQIDRCTFQDNKTDFLDARNNAELKVENEFLIFPNPSNGVVTFQNLSSSMVNVNIYSMTGQLVTAFSIRSENFQAQDLSSYSAGIYNVEFTDGINSSFDKLVISK